MKIEIPTELGNVIESNIQESGNNIVYAGDKHTSGRVQNNITKLYTYLADNHDLTIVGIEGSQSRMVVPKSEGRFSSKEFISRLEGTGLHTFHPFLIRKAAEYVGYELVIPDNPTDAKLAQMTGLIKWFLALPGEERDGQFPRFGGGLNNLLNSMSPEAAERTYPPLMDFLKSKDQESYNRFDAIQSLVRTEEQVAVVLNEMEQSQKTLALICRGNDHQPEFKEIARQKNFGYLIFEPFGYEDDDLLARYEKSRKFDAEDALNSGNSRGSTE